MTTAMGPPPPRNPTSTASESEAKTSEEPSTSSSKSSMGSPPPKNPIPPQPEPEPEPEPQIGPSESKPSQVDDSIAGTVDSTENPSSTSKDKDANQNKRKEEKGHGFNNIEVPYTIPPWNGTPCHQYFLEVLKDGSIIDQFDVNKKGAYMFGRVDLCDFVLEHPTISRFHAVIQFKSNGEAYLYDLGSTHGTYINKNEVKKKAYVGLHVGDVIRFGQSSRLYIFQGSADLMPPEADLKSMRNSKIRKDMQDMEASLLRAKLEASLADGISWGMQEDAFEEDEGEVDEITWQTYKGQLTEKQEKTREKVIKRLEKIAHMKKEIDAIRAKDIAQGGLTQGQQTQIARNEQRISQIMEELENLEETLNESIRESLGARAGKTSRGRRRGATEDDEEDYMSDDDEFYDRTQKPPKKKTGENQSIETADSLLEKKEAILKELEDMRKLLLDEDKRVQKDEVIEEGDALDAYMSNVSSQIALDKKDQLQKDLASLQSDLDRILYLLMIADPTGEAARRRESKVQKPKQNLTTVASDALELSTSEKGQSSRPEHSLNGSGKPERLQSSSIHKKVVVNSTKESSQKLEASEIVVDAPVDKTTVYTVVKPQWLGAVEEQKKQETIQEAPLDKQENNQFVDYKDRKTILEKADGANLNETSGIENAAPGLIIRKRKHVEKPDVVDVKASAEPEANEASSQEMEVDAQADETAFDNNGDSGGLKRSRDEGAEEGENNEDAKKLKADRSVEEERLEKTTVPEEKKTGSESEPNSGPVKLGPKSFESSVEMFDYFYKFLHFWTPNVNVNKYEHVMLLELLKKGHVEPDKKIGDGIRAFQVRYHPKFKSRCFFLTREDDSVDDFSFRKCVDHILPLPENMQVKQDVNKALGGGHGGKGGRGGGRGRGRGRGGKWRN